MQFDVYSCLDERNSDFYHNEVRAHLKVFFAEGGDNTIWTCKYSDAADFAWICYGNNYPHIESFTHEILHLYLYINGYSTFYYGYAQCFPNLVNYIGELEATLDGISNIISHKKMLPIFVERLRMNKDHFFSKDGIQFLPESSIEKIKNNFHTVPEEFSENFTNFIRHYFNTRYCFFDSLIDKYEQYQNDLRQTDPNLFGIMEACSRAWDSDLNNFENTNFFTDLILGLDKYLDAKFP